MFDNGRLPPPLHDELCVTVSRVFQSALGGFTRQASLAVTPDITDAVRASLSIAITKELRLCNARFSPQEKLPDEILCTIWGSLSFPDLVAVSHVCGRWRDVSRGRRRLWANPTLYTALSTHDDGYGCAIFSCADDDEPGYCDYNPYRGCSYNTRFVDQIFALSGDLPLHIRIDVVAICPHETILAELGAAIVPYAHRISGLTLLADHTPALGVIVANLDALPLLSSLSANPYDLQDAAGWKVKLFAHTMQLPLLEHIVLGNDFQWPSIPTLHLHNLRTPVFAPRDPEALLAVLSACAHLEEVSLGLLHLLPMGLSAELGGQIRELLAPVTSIRLNCVTSEGEQWVMATFSRPGLNHLSIGHYGSSDDAFALSYTIFKDLGDAARLTISAKDRWLFRALEIMDINGRTRVLVLLYDHLTRAVSRVLDPSCLRTDTLRHISVSLSCWDEFASACPPLLGVTSLELTIEETSDSNRVIELAVAGTHVSPLPELKDLRIVYTGRRPTFCFRPGEIARLARRVAPPPRLPLQTLVLRGLFDVPDEPLPDGLTQYFHFLHIAAYE